MNDWSNKPVAIVASGPSLCDEDLLLVRKWREADLLKVIVINDNWRVLHNADVLYAADHRWWTTYYEQASSRFLGQLWTCDDRVADYWPRIHYIRPVVGSGLPDTRDYITVGSTSTAQALQLAYIWGARKIALLGVDCKLGHNGRKHWFGDHPPGLDERPPIQRWVEEFSILAKELAASEVSVTNCSRDTALTCFTRTNLPTWLKSLS